MTRKPIIGIIDVTAHLYREKLPAFIEEIEKKYREIIQKSFVFADIINFSIAYERQMVEHCYERMIQAGVDGIVIMFPSYSPSMIIAPVLKKSKLPILLWNTQHLFEITRSFSSKDMMNNHGMHGIQDLACVLLREKVPFSIITGHHLQKDTLLNLENWCKCAVVYSDLKKLKVGRIGGKFKDMGDFSIPDSTVKEFFGTEIIDIEMSDLDEEAKNIPVCEIEKIMEDEEDRFVIEIDAETRENSARLERALRNLIKKYELGALAINFMAFRGKSFCRAIPFSVISKFISEGMGYGGEGDVVCAISVWIFQKLAGQATFTEMFTTDYKNNRIFMSHMGENNPLMAKNPSGIRLVEKDMSITQTGTKTGMFLFQMNPGDVTLFNLAPCKDEKFSIIVTTGSIEDEQLLPEINAPHFLFQIKKDVREFLNSYSYAGGTHHLAMAYGDHIEILRMFARISQSQFVKI